MANIAQSVNVISPLITTKDGVVKQATWWPLLLFSKYMRGDTVALNVRSPEYTGRTNPEWIRGTIETPFLDCSATIDNCGWVTLAVVNVSEECEYSVELSGLSDGEVEIFTVEGSNVNAVNTETEQVVKVEESKWNREDRFLFRKHSLTMLRWKA